jgi:hypothetical protein
MDFARYDRSGLNQTRWHDTIDRLALIGRSPTDICASVIYMLALGELAATFVDDAPMVLPSRDQPTTTAPRR